ncbi:MAG: tetratricopeptide repeat protein [Pseudomonadota bacterium]
MKVKTLSWFGGLIVIALSVLLLTLFQTLGRTQSIPNEPPQGSARYAAALQTYNDGDYGAAYEAFLDLAQKGNVDAKSMLGVMFFQGHGVVLNKVTAAIWFYQAARAGRPAAQLVLGRLYLAGDGVVTDIQEAGFWLSLAYNRGTEDVAAQAKQALDTVMPNLSEANRTAILKRVALWRPVMPDRDTLGG